MAGVQDDVYGDEDLDFSGIDPEELEDFRRRESLMLGSQGYEGTSSGSVRRPPLVIRNILMNAGEGQRDKGQGKRKSSMQVSPTEQNQPGDEEQGRRKTVLRVSPSEKSQAGVEEQEVEEQEVENGLNQPNKRARWDESFQEELQAREKALVSALTANMRAEMRSLFQENAAARPSVVDQQEWDKMRLKQRSGEIASRAAFLNTEGAKAQFIAFAKIKANLEEARAKVQAGDGDGVIAAFDRMEDVTDVRLELIERADSMPGGWPAATIFERIAQTGNANKTKFDKMWKLAVGEADSKKRDLAEKSGGQRGIYSFRSVLRFQFFFVVT